MVRVLRGICMATVKCNSTKMAASKKRRVAEKDENSSNSDNSDSEEMETEDLPQSEVQVDFEARTPNDADYHGIKRLLQQLFLKAHINTGELADILIKQDYMGSVLKQSIPEEDECDDDDNDDDDDTFGIFSVIDVTEKKNVVCIQQICNYLLDRCRKAASPEFEKFKGILNDEEKHVGLLITERFLNIPPQISVPLYEGLSEEMKRAKEEKKIGGFAYYMLISKLYEDDRSSNTEIMYANAEEELFKEDTMLSFDFSVSDEQDNVITGRWADSDAEWKPKRCIMVFPAEKWNILIEKLKTEVVSVT